MTTLAARASNGPPGPGLPPGAAYRMLLPEAWVRLPADSVGMRAAARRYLQQRFAELPRDSTVALRRRLEDELVAMAQTSGERMVVDLLLLSLAVGDVPIAASGVVSLVPLPLHDEEQLQQLAAVSRPGAVAADVVDLGANRLVRVVRDEAPTTVDGEPVPALGSPDRVVLGPDDGSAVPLDGSSRLVDYFLPVPDSSAVLLISLSTPVPPLFEPLTELFDSLVSTVQWHAEDGSWQ